MLSKNGSLRTIRLPMVGLLLATLVGCATTPPKVTHAPQDVLLARQLFDTQYAFIYAASENAAIEVSTDLAAAAREFQKTTTHTTTKGLVIVSDKQDPPYSADTLLVCRLVTQEEQARSTDPAAAEPVTQEKLDKVSEKIGPNLLHHVLLARCGSIEPAEAVRVFGLQHRPAASADWVIVAPTTAFVQQVAHEILAKAMSQPDVPFMAKLMFAPLGPLVEARAGQQISVNRQVALYAALIRHDPRLDPQTRTRLAVAFSERKQRAQQNSPLITALQDMQKKAAAATQASATADKQTRRQGEEETRSTTGNGKS